MKAAAGVIVALAVAVTVLATPSDADAFKRCGGLRASIKGTPGPDLIRGTKGFDVIAAGAGNDRVEGLANQDFICGGPGDDHLDGGDGGDKIKGGAGDDTVIAGAGLDYVYGQGGEDSADGGTDNDLCFTEHSTTCESDLSVWMGLGFSFTAGDQTINRLTVGASAFVGAATGAYTEVTLPPEATFVPDASDPRCTQNGPSLVTCAVGYLEGGRSIPPGPERTIAVQFPDCPPPGTTVSVRAQVADIYTAELRPENNVQTSSATLTPASSCP